MTSSFPNFDSALALNWVIYLEVGGCGGGDGDIERIENSFLWQKGRVMCLIDSLCPLNFEGVLEMEYTTSLVRGGVY